MQCRDDLQRTKILWQTPLVSAVWFDTAQTTAYEFVRTIKGVPSSRDYIWISHSQAAVLTAPDLVSGSTLHSDSEDSDSDQEDGEDVDDVVLQDILADVRSSDDDNLFDM